MQGESETTLGKLQHALQTVLPKMFGDNFVKLERKHRVALVDIEENELLLNVLVTARLTANSKSQFRSNHLHMVLCEMYKKRGMRLSRDDIAWLGQEASSIMSLFQYAVISIKRDQATRSIPLGRLRALWKSLGGWAPPKAQCEPFQIPEPWNGQWLQF